MYKLIYPEGEIKTCPHCGGSAVLAVNPSKCGYFIFVQCEICGARGKTCRDSKDPELYDFDTTGCDKAIKAWNMRVKES